MRLFFTAFQFLTIIPLPFALKWQEGDMGRSMRWFPLVGLAIGALLAGVDYGLSFIFPSTIVSLLLVTTLAIVTGALHLDGLADLCDGFGARGGRERFLSVMKDSGTGAVGVVGVTLALMLKYHAIANLPADARAGAIIFFPAAARYAQVLMTTGAMQVRVDGLAAAFISVSGRWELLLAGLTTVAASWFLLGAKGLFCCIIISLFTWFSRIYFHRRLGGVTGDIIGANSEIAEIISLLAIMALAGV